MAPYLSTKLNLWFKILQQRELQPQMVSQANSIRGLRRKKNEFYKISSRKQKRRKNFQTRLMISELITLLPRSDRDITRKEKLQLYLHHEHGHNNSQRNISLRQYKPHIVSCFKQIFFKEGTKINSSLLYLFTISGIFQFFLQM